MMPLSMAKEGEPVVIKKVGGKDETRQFLENLGFVAGGTVTVVSDQWKPYRQCKGVPRSDRQRYGQQNYGLIHSKSVRYCTIPWSRYKKSNRKEEKNYENPEKCCRRADSHREKADW